MSTDHVLALMQKALPSPDDRVSVKAEGMATILTWYWQQGGKNMAFRRKIFHVCTDPETAIEFACREAKAYIEEWQREEAP